MTTAEVDVGHTVHTGCILHMILAMEFLCILTDSDRWNSTQVIKLHRTKHTHMSCMYI